MEPISIGHRTTVTFDNVIFRVQSARGATMYWRRLREHLDQREDVTIVDRDPRTKLDRYLPVVGAGALAHTSLFRWTLPGSRTRLVMTAHDLAYERGFVPGRRAKVGQLERRLAVSRASGIVCVSDATHADLHDYYGAALDHVDITVAHHGPSLPVIDGSDVEIENPGGLRLALHVGHRGEYKNFSGLRKAVVADPGLAGSLAVIVVGPPPTEDEESFVPLRWLQHRLIVPEEPGWYYAGRVSDEVLSGLYQSVDVLVSPSRFEGFGFPVLDALVHGCRVACSNIPSHREIADGIAAFFDPDDEASIRIALGAALEGEPPVGESVERRLARFSWERSAAQHARLYRSLDTGGSEGG